ncbi:MAG: AN1-type zinc finger domain-containing protein [Candidatus Bathyarchaeia archaeon]
MVQCEHCGEDVYMPFRCNYCGGYFCSKHRLPEFHDCTGLNKQRSTTTTERIASTRSYDYYYRPYRRGSTLQDLLVFSDRELRDLVVSLIVISALSLQVMWENRLLLRFSSVVFGAVIIFAAAFLFHEIAHKFVAQKLGYWAEFRLNTFGLILTLMSFFTRFKLVAPGAVVIAGLMYGDDYGKTSLAGPITNIAQSVLYTVMRLLTTNPFVKLLAYVGVVINSSIALFNLIPFGVFDGAKILRWDWRIWLATTATAGLLYLYASL